jgi:quercetin 2,3-dioxygenase
MEFSPAKMFLSEQRSLIGNNRYSAHCIFDEQKEPFGNLYLFNEDVLNAAAEVEMMTAFPSYVILIPVTGELLCKDNAGRVSDVDAGKVLISRKAAGESFKVMNMYEEGAIHFLHLQINEMSLTTVPFTSINSFGLDNFRNNLFDITQPVADNMPFRICIGQFGGREKGVFKAAGLCSLLFAFVISGAFEIEDRLLHPGDGLAMWKIGAIEMEALSSDATLLIVEMDT